MTSEILDTLVERDFLISKIDTRKDLDFGFHNGLDKPLQVKTLKDIRFEYKGVSHVIEAGFISDGTSYPFDVYEAFKGREIRAAIIHDYLCKKENQGLLSQKDTHVLYRKILKADGVSKFKRNKMFVAVRTYNHGFLNWNNLKWK